MASKRKVNENKNQNQENDDEGSSSSSRNPPNAPEKESGGDELNAKRIKLNGSGEGDATGSLEVEAAKAELKIGAEAAIMSAAELVGARPGNNEDGRAHISHALQTALEKISNPIKDNLIHRKRMGGVLILFNEEELNDIVDKIQTKRDEWERRTPRILALFESLDEHWEALSATAIAVLKSHNVRYEVDSVTNMLIAFEPGVVTLVELAGLPEVEWIKGPTLAYSTEDDEIDMDDSDDEDDSDDYDSDNYDSEEESGSEASGMDTDDSEDDEEEEVVYAN